MVVRSQQTYYYQITTIAGGQSVDGCIQTIQSVYLSVVSTEQTPPVDDGACLN
jgi:hypothetical protein